MNIYKSVIFLAFSVTSVFGQLEQFGLGNEKVTSLAVSQTHTSNEFIAAGTDSHGIFMRNFTSEDTSWINHYFYNRSVSSIFIQRTGAGLAEFSRIFVSLLPNDSPDSTLVYSTINPIQSYWSKTDSGLNRKEINKIVSFAGFDYAGHEPPQPVFCCAQNPHIYILKNTAWEKSWSGLEIVSINQLFANNSTVFACGTFYGFIPTPVILKSKDSGQTWEEFSPFPNHMAYSITASANDSDTIYVGLNNKIIKSTDGGINWTSVLEFENTHIHSLLINPLNPNQIFAGGKTFDNMFILFKSEDSGNTWDRIDIGWNCKCIIMGINCMAGKVNDNKFEIYIGTDGSGVYKYISKNTNIESESIITNDFKLYQNFPNPFNPSTTIKYSIAPPNLPNSPRFAVEAGGEALQHVQLKVYDMLGKEVTILVNEEKSAGNYEVKFNGSNFTSGIYFYNLTTGRYRASRKMLLIK